MKILWINNISDTEIWRTTQLELTGALRRKGHNVILVMAKNIGEKKSKDENIIYIPTTSTYLSSGLLFGLIVFCYFPFFIWKKKPDVIIIDENSVWLPFALTFKLFNIPIIIDIRSLPIKEKYLISFDIPLYLSKYMIDGLTTITPELEEILRKKYNLKDKKIGIWPSGVSTEMFIRSDKEENIDYKTDPNKFVIIHHGSHGGLRGIENLIKSIGELDKSLRKKTDLLLVGVPKAKMIEYSELCKKIGVTEQVKIFSKVEYKKIPSFIKSANVGIIPLDPNHEWWKVSVPLKTLEYLGMGKPIIATSIPFHQRLFKKGECGILIDSDSPKALSDAINFMYQNREKLDEMGRIGKEIVKSCYTWDCIACDVEKFLKDILVDKSNETVT